jgi:hypothetical protein
LWKKVRVGLSADVVKQVQRELAYHAFLKSMGIPVAELVETPAAKKLWSRGVITYKRSPGREVGKVFGRGQYAPGRFPKLDGLISRVEAMKSAFVRLTGDQYGVMLSNEVPLIPRYGVEVTPKKIPLAGGGTKTVYVEAATGKELARGELNAYHYYPVSKNGVTFYNTAMGVDVGFDYSNIFVNEATGTAELIDF